MLDVGCGSGCCTFELTRGFDEAVGLEVSQALFTVCEQLKETGEMEFTLTVEGELKETKLAAVDPIIVRTPCLLFEPIKRGLLSWLELETLAIY